MPNKAVWTAFEVFVIFLVFVDLQYGQVTIGSDEYDDFFIIIGSVIGLSIFLGIDKSANKII